MVPLYDKVDKTDPNIKNTSLIAQAYNANVHSKDYSNVSLKLEVLMMLEILMCFLAIARALIRIKFKLQKGIGKKINVLLSQLFLLRIVLLLLLTIAVFNYSGEVCLCHFRDDFYEKCYFNDPNFQSYTCFPNMNVEEWTGIASKQLSDLSTQTGQSYDLENRRYYYCADDTIGEQAENLRHVEIFKFMRGMLIMLWICYIGGIMIFLAIMNKEKKNDKL